MRPAADVKGAAVEWLTEADIAPQRPYAHISVRCIHSSPRRRIQDRPTSATHPQQTSAIHPKHTSATRPTQTSATHPKQTSVARPKQKLVVRSQPFFFILRRDLEVACDNICQAVIHTGTYVALTPVVAAAADKRPVRYSAV